MLEIESERYGFKTKTIWFSEAPYDVSGYDGVTFLSCTKNADLEGFSKQKFTTLVIDLTQDIDTIWGNMKKDSCRRPINKAIREGVKVTVNQRYDDFVDLCSSFRRAKGLPPYEISIETMKKHGMLFISELDGEILCGRFCYADKDHIRGAISASKRLDASKEDATLIGCANRLNIWEAIKYAKASGIKEYDMGGYYTGETSDPQKERINMFKESFGGEMTVKYNYQKDYSIAYSLGKKVMQCVNGLKNGYLRE